MNMQERKKNISTPQCPWWLRWAHILPNMLEQYTQMVQTVFKSLLEMTRNIASWNTPGEDTSLWTGLPLTIHAEEQPLFVRRMEVAEVQTTEEAHLRTWLNIPAVTPEERSMTTDSPWYCPKGYTLPVLLSWTQTSSLLKPPGFGLC